MNDKFLWSLTGKKRYSNSSNGKFVAPQLIVNLFKESLLIDQVMVVGNTRNSQAPSFLEFQII
jgi:long-chain acyl-CoA synthetase